MLCPNCQKENKKGSRFCQYCGTSLTEPAIEPEVIAVEPAEAPVEAPIAAPVAETTQEPAMEVTPEAEAPAAQQAAAPEEEAPQFVPVEEAPAKPIKEKKAKKEKGKKPALLIVIAAVLAVLFLASAGLNVYQYLHHQELVAANEQEVKGLKASLAKLTKEKKELQQQLEDTNQTVDELWATIEEMSAAMNEEAEMLDAYCRLEDSLIYSDLGYYSDEFYVDYAVLTLKVGQEETLTLTTAWEGSGTVDLVTDTEFASVDFATDSWSTEVEIKVVANEVGLTIATFTWEEAEASFDVIILVYEE